MKPIDYRPSVIEPSHFPVDVGPAAAPIFAAAPEKRMAAASDLLAALWIGRPALQVQHQSGKRFVEAR